MAIGNAIFSIFPSRRIIKRSSHTLSAMTFSAAFLKLYAPAILILHNLSQSIYSMKHMPSLRKIGLMGISAAFISLSIINFTSIIQEMLTSATFIQHNSIGSLACFLAAIFLRRRILASP